MFYANEAELSYGHVTRMLLNLAQGSMLVVTGDSCQSRGNGLQQWRANTEGRRCLVFLNNDVIVYHGVSL